MAGRAIPRTFPSDESSFFTDAGQFALAVTLFCKNSVESSSSRLGEFHNSSLYIINRSDVNIETNHPQLIRELNQNMKLLIPLMQTLVKKKNTHIYTHIYITG